MAIMDRSMEGKRQYTTGISKGVFFGEDGKAFPWNGLISVTDKPQVNAPTPVYNSLGEKYDQFGNIAEKKHSLTCYTYPEEMDEFLGVEYLEEMGYSVDERPPKKFSMAYRTEMGDGLYEIHVLLNQIATFGDTAKNTITNNITPTVVTMNLEGVPDPRIKSSHIILDSRLPLTASAERLLFGDNMVDGNINEFLDAEPTWVTVATNYAPIIEPDYDNMLWLGGRNLWLGTDKEAVTAWSNNNTTFYSLTYGSDATGEYLEGYANGSAADSINTYFLQPYTNTALFSTTDNYADASFRIAVGYEMMFSHDAKLSGNDVRNIPNGATLKAGVWHHIIARSFSTRPSTPIISRVDGKSNEPLRVYIRKFKIELTQTSVLTGTPWTPPPERTYVLPANEPRPDNYVPGVKSGAWMDMRLFPARNSIAYYDEVHKGLGHYSTRLSGEQSNITIRNNRIPRTNVMISLTVKANVTEDIPAVLQNTDNNVYTPSPRKEVAYPNTKGVHSVRHDLVHTSVDPNYRLHHGGNIGSPVIVYTDLMITEETYQGEFFDIFTTPKTKGDRYVRERLTSGTVVMDYTIHQQLLLQSKSRVLLSDITRNQYTLEASDSQLRVDGRTFTFKGPQATPVGDDQFTINDEIYGED